MSKKTLKNRFFGKTIENQAKHLSGFLDELWLQIGVNFFQSEKTTPCERGPKAVSP